MEKHLAGYKMKMSTFYNTKFILIDKMKLINKDIIKEDEE